MKNKDNWSSVDHLNYLKNKKMYHFDNFEKYSESWDHEHCEFCMTKFSEYDCDLHSGYMDTKINGRGTSFICEDCFEKYKDSFNWTLDSDETSLI